MGGNRMRNYAELITSAGKAMFEKLMENGHKCGFDEIPIVYAIGRAEDELEELYGAHDEYLFSKNQYDLQPHSKDSKERLLKAIKEMRREAADASNFPAMIILKCDKMIAELEG
jgi:hypothetical protein